MKTILCLLLSMVAALSEAQTIISLNDSIYSQATMPKRNVEETEGGIIVTYYFDNAIALQDLLYPECITWKIPGFGLNGIVGKPAIPSRWDSFSLPQNTTAEVEVIDSSYVDFTIQLSPARPVLIDSDTIEHTLDNVLPIMPYEVFFPSSLIEGSLGNAYRGVPLLDVGISPLQYDCKRKIIRAYTMIKYKISFLSSSRGYSASNNIDFNDNYLAITTSNPLSATSAPSRMRQTEETVLANRDYLIVTNTELRSVAEEFAEWKRILGFRTTIATKDIWSSQAVKDTIARYYNDSSYNLYYLLIIGDDNIVPTTYAYHSPTHQCVTDLHYVCMDGKNDIIPDIYYGRIPANDSLDVKNILNKIQKYERAPITEESFYRTGLNCAYFQDVKEQDGYADRRFAQTSEEVLQYLVGQGKTVHRVYYTEEDNNPLCWNNGSYGFGDSIPSYLRKPEFAWNGNSSDIINHINQGVFYVLHRDHGEIGKWRDPCFERTHIDQLSNQDRLPVVFSLNCKTGGYHESLDEDCFAETFLKKEDGGCVAIYAATGSSLSGYNDALTTGMFDAIWPSPGLRSEFPCDSKIIDITPTPSPTYELGQVLEVGMARMRETWGEANKNENGHKYFMRYTQELFHVFGDPSMQIYTDCPTNIQTPEVFLTGDTIHIKVKDGNARISFYNPSSKQVDTYYGTNVRYQTSSNNLNICISRHNHIPYMIELRESIYIQNETFHNDGTYWGNIIKVGRNVTNEKPQGNVEIVGGKTCLVGEKVELHSGTRIGKGAALKVKNP